MSVARLQRVTATLTRPGRAATGARPQTPQRPRSELSLTPPPPPATPPRPPAALGGRRGSSSRNPAFPEEENPTSPRRTRYLADEFRLCVQTLEVWTLAPFLLLV